MKLFQLVSSLNLKKKIILILLELSNLFVNDERYCHKNQLKENIIGENQNFSFLYSYFFYYY